MPDDRSLTPHDGGELKPLRDIVPDFKALEEMVNKMTMTHNLIRQAALTLTRPRDWLSIGEEPYMRATACDAFARQFGISSSVVDHETERLSDDLGEQIIYRYRVRAWVRHPVTGELVEAEKVGSCSTRDKFFGTRSIRGEDGKKKTVFLPLSQISLQNVEKKAETNARARAIKSILGFHPTWDELRAAFGGKGVEQMKAVDFDEPAQKQTSSGRGVMNKAKKEVGDLLLEMHRGDKQAAATALEALTTFKGREGKQIPGVRSVVDLTDKQAGVVLGKVRKLYEEWQAQHMGADRQPGDEDYGQSWGDAPTTT